MGSTSPTEIPNQEEAKKAATLMELTRTLEKKIKESDDRFKGIPTPIDFAKLQTDVKHHGNIIYGLVFILVGALIGGYVNFDNKIDAVTDRMMVEIKSLDGVHGRLEEKIDNEAKQVNGRIDNIIIQNNKSINATASQ